LEPYTFAGLLFGAMLPYFFSALTMAAVGSAANDMIDEIQRQIFYMQDFIAARPDKKAGYFVKIESKDFDSNFNEVFPNHDSCVKISTTASLRKMVAPGCIVILSPLIFGALFGHRFVSGMLAGTITSGIQIAFSASNTGGAWDNCKKYIEAKKQERTADGIMNIANTKEIRP
jgi:inorganic pyrophosphatase